MTPTLSTPVPNNGVRARPASSPVPMFFLVGLLETSLAYFAFSRADDHAYFLELANLGLSVVPDYAQDLLSLKAKAAGVVFYTVASPSRWLGGHELLHLLWFRALTLAGFLSAFSWFQRVASPAATGAVRNKSRVAFMTLVLLYPGQLAWTASLLRDGIATALFFFGLACVRKDWRLLLTLPLFGASFALRPEYSLILFCLLLALQFHRLLERVSWRVLSMIGVLLAFSMVTYATRAESAAFAQLAFGDSGLAYPQINSPLDVVGYLRVFLQGVLDPLALDAPQLNAFGLIDCAFFAYLLLQSRRLLRHRLTRVAALSSALLFGLWTFAYFEIYVSGFSRHRLCLQVALIALIAICHVSKTPRRRKPVPR